MEIINSRNAESLIGIKDTKLNPDDIYNILHPKIIDDFFKSFFDSFGLIYKFKDAAQVFRNALSFNNNWWKL